MNERHGRDESQRNTEQHATCSRLTEATMGGSTIVVAEFEYGEDFEESVHVVIGSEEN